MPAWIRDLRFACRSLARNRAWAAVVVGTVALAVGANTLIFSVVDGVLLRPLPYDDPERLVTVWQTRPAWKDSPHANLRSWWDRFPVSYPVFQDWLAREHVFEHLGVYRTAAFTLTGGDRPERISGIRASSGVFAALGVPPALGRVFTPQDDALGAANLAVLSHGFWQRRFGGEASVLGRTLHLDREPFTVVGVMPAGFYFPRRVDLWTTISDAGKKPERGTRFFEAVARLGPGISLARAQREMDAVSAAVAEADRKEPVDGVRLVSRLEEVVGEVRPAMVLLLATVALVLLIACANVANLLLVRLTERRRELAVRTTLGAGRGRLLTLLLGESMALSIAGGALGFTTALWCLEPLIRLLPPGLPRTGEIAVDARVLLFSLALTLGTGLLVGALPALGASRARQSQVLGEAGRGTPGRRRHRTQAVLVVSEMALAFVLLVGAALLAKSFVHLSGVERGFEVENLLLMSLHPPEESYPEERRRAFYDQLSERLAALPGVTHVATADTPPFAGRFRSSSATVDTPAGIEETHVEMTHVTPPYFDTVRVPLIAGRAFVSQDREGALQVAILSRALAEKHWGGASPVGGRIKTGDADSEAPWLEIVGVAEDVRHQALDVTPHPRLYRPAAQTPASGGRYVLLATAGDPAQVAAPARDAVWAIDPDLPILRLATLDERIGRTMAAPRFRTLLVTVLAVLAAVLALVGTYAVMAYTVTRRTREIGVRMALGARRHDVVAHVLGRGLRLAAAGSGLGLVLALGSVRLLEGFLFETSPHDPLFLAAAALLLGGAALSAAWVPARRASRVDPAVALSGD